MRKFILTLSLWGMALLLGAQNYQVSTAVQPKNVLLEEFTGVYCGYCPEGHQIGGHLKQILEDRISIVAIHCGPFAPSYGDEMDYTVLAGQQIGDLLGATSSGFPNGAVNRRGWHNYGKRTYGRAYWEDFARRVVEEKSPVNLWGEAVWNAENQEMKVRVEGYFTEDIASSLRLHLMLTQNNVLGYQSGGNLGSKYPHQHMLREAITGVGGDVLPEGRQGEYFVKEYVYQMPDTYKKVAVDPAEMELVAYVSQENMDVLNAITVKPEYVGEDLPLKASLRTTKIKVAGTYGYSFFPMVLTNKCNQTITSATFEVIFNGETVEREWTGEILPFVTREIRIPVDWNQKSEKVNSYKVMLKSLNGEEYAGGTLSGKFSTPTVLPAQLDIRIHTDEFAADNTYQLCNEDGEVLRTFGPFENGSFQSYEETLYLEPGTMYCIEVHDVWGNGAYPHGNALELAKGSGLTLLSLSVIQNFGNRIFFKTDVASGITDLSSTKEYEVYGISGKLLRKSAQLKELPKGVYIVRSGTEVHKVCIR